MKENYQDQLKEYLLENETLLWTGKPKRGIVFRDGEIIIIPFSLLWGGFMIYFGTRLIASNTPKFLFLIAIPLLLIGLYAIIGRFIVDITKRSRTYYGFTENRILIRSGIFFRKIKSVNIKMLLDIELIERSNGRGTIYLNPSPNDLDKAAYFFNSMSFGAESTTASQLELIEHPRKVYNQILKIQNKKLDNYE